MSTTVQQIFQVVNWCLLEDSGPVLGVYTQQQFLDILGVVLLDFAQRAGLYKNIFTTPIKAGVSQYAVPDDVMKPEVCFVGGRLIEQATEAELAMHHMNWRTQSGPTRQWHEDNLAPKVTEIFPRPDWNGTSYAESGPPTGMYDVFNPGDRNLTFVGPAAPDIAAWSLGDTLQCVPDSFSLYIAYGILEQIFSGDNELKDAQRALYARTRYQEGIQLADAIAREELMESDDE